MHGEVACSTGDTRAAVAERLAGIKVRMATALTESGRYDPVHLIAVSKTYPAAMVEAALAAGQRDFGENRVQEAAGKFPALREAWPDIRLHLIGGLQTNKAEEAVRLADVIHSLDRLRLLDAVSRAAERQGRCPQMFVQVNIGDEPQKSGIPPAEADSFIMLCRARLGDKLVGLMCIPPADDHPLPHFRALAELAARHGLPSLSMGMSGDFEAAIRAGATHVRVGTAIFGSRPQA